MTLIQSFIQVLEKTPFKGDIETSKAYQIAYASDNSPYFIPPQLILFPKNQEDIQYIVRCLNREGFETLSLTARGGGTGTNGQSLNSGIICDVTRYMNKVEHIDLINEEVIVQPGVVLDDLNKELAKEGYFFPPSLSPSNRATIGGMINTDAAGKGSRKYGKTSEYVKELDIISHKGTVLNSEGSIVKGLDSVLDACHQHPLADEIKTHYVDQPRFLSGYNLRPYALDKINTIRHLISGSEGTLGLVTKARLSIRKKPKFSHLIIVVTRSLLGFLEHIPELLELDVDAIEMMDRNLVQHTEFFTSIEDAVFYCEFSGDHFGELLSKCELFKTKVTTYETVIETHHVTDTSQIRDYWQVRKKALGFLSDPYSFSKPLSGMEDMVVPVEDMSDVVQDIQDLMAQTGRTYCLYGHVDVGCLHLRPIFDMRDPKEVELYQEIADALFFLVQSVQGIFWGEHSKGLRTQYMMDYFPEQILNKMKEVKYCFDPRNIFNPGKIVPPTHIPFETQRLIDHPLQGKREQGLSFYPPAMCNGNALCQSSSPQDVMCPTSKPDRSQAHSPRGRALALKELQIQGKSLSRKDEHALKKLIDGCISCKACKTQCPVHVDIAHQKALYLHRYYSRRVRPLMHYVLRYAERGLSWLRFNKRQLQTQTVVPEHLDQPVVLFQDVFTSFLNPQILEDTISVLEALGKDVIVLPFQPSRKVDHLLGFMESFESHAKMIANWLRPLVSAGVPIIGIEPSTTLMFYDEYHEVIGARPLVKPLSTYLKSQRFPEKTRTSQSFTLLEHCHEQALKSSGVEWQSIFEACGQKLTLEKTSCCGMAGIFGIQRKNKEFSKKIYKTSFQPIVDTHTEGELLATGASCRSQIKRFSHKVCKHPVQVLKDLI